MSYYPGGGGRTYGGQDPNSGGYSGGGYSGGGYSGGGYSGGGYNDQGGYSGGGYSDRGSNNNQDYSGGGYSGQGGYSGGGYSGGGYSGGGYNDGGYSGGGYSGGGYSQGGPPQGPPPGGYGGGGYNNGGYSSGGGYGGPPPGPPPDRTGWTTNSGWTGFQEGGYDNPNYGGSHDVSGTRFQAPPTQAQSFGVEGYNYQYSQCTGRRKALLIGINYFGQKGELKGCINDVHNVKRFLQETYGYRDEDTVVLTDDQKNPKSIPTKENIIRACQWLTRGAQPNDSLFFHYSGHGGQTEDLSGDEEDGYDEVIYPVDYARAGHIVDDTLHELLVKPLPAGARLTAIFDCCHSATALDLPYVYSTKGVLKEPNLLKDTGKSVFSALSSYSRGDIGGVMTSVTGAIDRLTKGNKASEKTKKDRTSPADVIMFSGCKDNQTSADSFEDGSPTGAMSHAFLQVMRNNPNQSYLSLLNNTRDILASKYDQKPQLSSSHPLDCNLKFIM